MPNDYSCIWLDEDLPQEAATVPPPAVSVEQSPSRPEPQWPDIFADAEFDPVAHALANAPVDDEPLTPEEAQAIEEALAEPGPFKTHAEVAEALGIFPETEELTAEAPPVAEAGPLPEPAPVVTWDDGDEPEFDTEPGAPGPVATSETEPPPAPPPEEKPKKKKASGGKKKKDPVEPPPMVQVRLENGEVHTVQSIAAENGLAVTPVITTGGFETPKKYAITHIASGKLISDVFDRKTRIIEAMKEIAALAPWTLDPVNYATDELRATKNAILHRWAHDKDPAKKVEVEEIET